MVKLTFRCGKDNSIANALAASTQLSWRVAIFTPERRDEVIDMGIAKALSHELHGFIGGLYDIVSSLQALIRDVRKDALAVFGGKRLV